MKKTNEQKPQQTKLTLEDLIDFIDKVCLAEGLSTREIFVELGFSEIICSVGNRYYTLEEK